MPGTAASRGKAHPVPEISVVTTEHDLTELYRSVLTPTFPPEELSDLDLLLADLAGGRLMVLAGRDGGEIVAGAVIDGAGPVRMVSYLAIAPQGRGAGLGGRLLSTALATVGSEPGVRLIVAEVEDPAHHGSDPDRGDPTARLRFYARRGAQLLDLPYFQPGVRPGAARVEHMLLLALEVDPELVVPGQPPTIPPQPLLDHLTDYWLRTEGAVGDDPACRALFEAASRPIPLLPLAV